MPNTANTIAVARSLSDPAKTLWEDHATAGAGFHSLYGKGYDAPTLTPRSTKIEHGTTRALGKWSAEDKQRQLNLKEGVYNPLVVEGTRYVRTDGKGVIVPSLATIPRRDYGAHNPSYATFEDMVAAIGVRS